ncbi:hypothetical protein [Hymenobacter sp. BT559]|uniref:hypothetical protein n=1 Tax=Hymenobacter sp. BT559 TaxID=2795729 RepID=UPI0018EE3A19|nr:hypothetical protein [Hymenobacter sp. BT559]MBJ6142818.1 hypothetical protein [Hymenobacter sp. BT559]
MIFTAFTVQTSTFNQAGSGNNQKVEVEKNKFQQELAATPAACQCELAPANALVAAKDETITRQLHPLQLMYLTQHSPEERLETRYQDLIAKFRAAQTDFHLIQSQCAHLQFVVRMKQEVIEELLPYYPHPLTSAMQAKIYLT